MLKDEAPLAPGDTSSGLRDCAQDLSDLLWSPRCTGCLAGKGQAAGGGSAEPAGAAGCSQVVHPGVPAPSPPHGAVHPPR